MPGRFLIATAFPQPPGSMLRAWELLQIVRRGDADEMAESGVDLNDLPRPWMPGQCPTTFARYVDVTASPGG